MLLELRVMEVMVATGVIRHVISSQIITHHHQQTNTQCFTGRMSFLSPNQQRQSTEVKIYQSGSLFTGIVACITQKICID